VDNLETFHPADPKGKKGLSKEIAPDYNNQILLQEKDKLKNCQMPGGKTV